MVSRSCRLEFVARGADAGKPSIPAGSHPSLLHLHQILQDRRENLLHLAELRLKQNELELVRVRESDKKAVMSWWQVSRDSSGSSNTVGQFTDWTVTDRTPRTRLSGMSTRVMRERSGDSTRIRRITRSSNQVSRWAVWSRKLQVVRAEAMCCSAPRALPPKMPTRVDAEARTFGWERGPSITALMQDEVANDLAKIGVSSRPDCATSVFPG